MFTEDSMADSPLQTSGQPTPAHERRRNNAASLELPTLGKANLQLHSFQPGRRNILFVTSELADLAKTGGLGEVSAALPHALAGLHDVRGSLRYWVAEMHVDGFRFDLASGRCCCSN
jgi:starch synthase